jgi:hypothetical protein
MVADKIILNKTEHRWLQRGTVKPAETLKRPYSIDFYLVFAYKKETCVRWYYCDFNKNSLEIVV